MKKSTYTIISFFLFFSCLYAQENLQNVEYPKELVIYSNTTKNTNLFFSSSIKSGIVGNPNFTFGYSPNGDSKIGILKASPGSESNLLVITSNGNIFSFIVRYKAELSLLNYFIKDDMAIGNENGEIFNNEKSLEPKGNKNNEVVETSKLETSSSELTSTSNAITVNDFELNKSDSIPENNLENIAKLELAKPIFYKRIYGTKNKVFVKLKNITYANNELYFSLILKNDSTLDYDLNYLNFYIISRNKSRNTVSQSIPYEPLYVENKPTRINANSEIEVVYVYKKFTINENKLLLIELSEDNGERTIKLEIPNSFINNPNLK